MFTHCCGHATIVAWQQPLFGLIRCCNAASIGQSRRRKVRCRPSVTMRAIDSGVSPARDRLAGISRNQMGISKGLRYRESHNAIRSTVAAPDLSIAAISHLDATMSDIHHVRNVLNGSRHFCAAGTFCASFRHAMRQPTTCAPRAELLFMQVRTTSCAICRRGFCAPSEMRHALNDRPHERLSRHHIAPAPRKSAACTSSHGPVWLFILRCG